MMLGALKLSRVDEALTMLGSDILAADCRDIFFDEGGLWVLPRHLDGDPFLVYAPDESDPVWHTALRKVWGGDLNKVVEIHVFDGGYTVETCTDVQSEGQMVTEVRVGLLVS